MFPTNEKYRINGHRNSRRTRYYLVGNERLTAKEIADHVGCHVDKARTFLNKYNMPPEKFIKLMLENKKETDA